MTQHAIRAIFDERKIRVYQAYSPEIALPALQAGRFVPPFSMTRMTWIKPSFHWMMYRCGHGSKPGQEVVLALDITREGFEWALAHAARASFSPEVYDSHEAWKGDLERKPVRVQWDPERDVTPIARKAAAATAPTGLPSEREKPYPLPSELAAILRE